MSSKHISIVELDAGFHRCSSCSTKLDLEDYRSLQIIRCPKCQNPEFIPKKIAEFWLYQPLGGGGMGSVYKALHTEDRRREFAVKVLPRAEVRDESLIKALYREGEAGLKIGSHPHVVEVVEYGQSDEEYFMATEFISGERMDIFMEEYEEIPENSVVKIMKQILLAEMHIYSRGYLFRDLKPENVMIEPDGNIRLFDYGLCLPIEIAEEGSEDDSLEGSPYYIPPERIMGQPEGQYSEIYTMGMLFYYLLSGSTYYHKADVIKLVRKHIKSLRMVSVANRLKYCSRKTVAIIDRMIARDPEKRYQRFQELMVELDSIQIDETRGWVRKRIEAPKKSHVWVYKLLLPITGGVILLAALILVIYLMAKHIM